MSALSRALCMSHLIIGRCPYHRRAMCGTTAAPCRRMHQCMYLCMLICNILLPCTLCPKSGYSIYCVRHTRRGSRDDIARFRCNKHFHLTSHMAKGERGNFHHHSSYYPTCYSLSQFLDTSARCGEVTS